MAGSRSPDNEVMKLYFLVGLKDSIIVEASNDQDLDQRLQNINASRLRTSSGRLTKDSVLNELKRKGIFISIPKQQNPTEKKVEPKPNENQ